MNTRTKTPRTHVEICGHKYVLRRQPETPQGIAWKTEMEKFFDVYEFEDGWCLVPFSYTIHKQLGQEIPQKAVAAKLSSIVSLPEWESTYKETCPAVPWAELVDGAIWVIVLCFIAAGFILWAW